MNRARALIPAVLALLYGASPIDLIPDLIPILGLSDDLTVFVIAFMLILHGLRTRRERLSQPRVILAPQRSGVVDFDLPKTQAISRFDLP